MEIIIHRGTHQIGGCITEIKTQNARIVIDIGAELPTAEKAASAPPRIEGLTCDDPACDGVFITHYHGDHVGMFGAVLPAIPIYMGAAAREIYAVVQRAADRGQDYARRVEDFIPFEAGKPIFIKDIKITPYLIDHSAFDAYMFLIEAEGKRILHTGDFRMHGARGRKMPAVFEKYAKNIDVLIVEGTMMSRRDEKPMTEHELGAAAKEILREHKSVFVLCSSTNIDTIAEFYSAAMAEGRMFLVCEEWYQLEILRIVSAASRSAFYDFDRGKIYVYGKNLHAAMAERGFCFIGRANAVTRCAMESFADNVLIYSMWRGYLDAASAAYDGYKREFVERAVANGSTLEYLHTSGHADIDQLRQVCAMTDAKTVIPVHSECPEEFGNLGLKGKVLVLRDGESVTV